MISNAPYRLLLTLLLFLPALTHGQVTEAPAPTATTQDELAAPEQVVEVDEAAEDDDIGTRLQSILESTDRFANPKVEVDNGVVFLYGTTEKTEYKDWARQLALKTQDVVAVVNNITVQEMEVNLWDFTPAYQEIRNMGREFVLALPMVALGLLILLLTLLAGRVALYIARGFLKQRMESVILREVISRTIVVFVSILGLYFFLRISGLTSLALAMLSGTGVIGLLVGLAFRDIAENFLASVLISIQKPFRVGDTIAVDGHTGVVQKVTTRGTVLMAFDGNYIQIANATIYKNTIENFTANPNTRMDFAIGVGYDGPVSKSQSIIMEVLRAHEAVLNDPEPTVLVEALGSSTINLRVYYWVDVSKHSGLKVNSAIIRLTLAALTEAGISMPDDAREIVFPEGVPVLQIDKQEQQEEKERIVQQASAQARQEKEPESTESEGNLGSDVANLNAQAQAAPSPEEGSDLLATDGRKRGTAPTSQ